MERKYWREQWLNSIRELTSIDLQKATWLDIENLNPHWSFIEFNCSYFDDLLSGENYIHVLECKFIDDAEYEILKDWHKKLEAYEAPNSDDYNHQSILEDNNWREIVALGHRAKLNLAKRLGADEKEILLKI